MSCQHEWTESIRCAKCGQAIESRIAVGRQLDEALDLLAECEAELVNRGPVAEIRALLEKHGRHP